MFKLIIWLKQVYSVGHESHFPLKNSPFSLFNEYFLFNEDYSFEAKSAVRIILCDTYWKQAAGKIDWCLEIALFSGYNET